MSRIRTIKPQFFRHEELFDAERESGLPLRLAFISIWTVADREGRFKWRPRSMKSECLPFDEIDFSRVLDALATRGFIVHYAVDGEHFGAIPSFSQHQVVNNREVSSEIPGPNKNNILDACRTRGDACMNSLGSPLGEQERKGTGKGTGKEEKKQTKKFPAQGGLDFQKFYDSFPKHVGPQAAAKKFKAVVASGVEPLRIIDAAIRFAEAHRKAGTDKQYIPAPAVWLNQGRYDDKDLPTPPNGRGRSNGTEGFVKSVLEDIENDRRRREEGTAEVIPMLQRERQ